MTGYLDPVGEGRQIVLDKAVVFVGRAADCDVVLTRSRKISRKHCCIAQVGNQYVVRDLGSLNGVRVNGSRIKHEARLKYGDELAIGDVLYVLRPTAEEAERANGNGPAKAASKASLPPASSPRPTPPPEKKPSQAPPPAVSEFALLLPEADEQLPEFPPAAQGDSAQADSDVEGDWLLDKDTP